MIIWKEYDIYSFLEKNISHITKMRWSPSPEVIETGVLAAM